MAVEIKRRHSKQLYKHATPVLLASTLLLTVSAVAFTHYSHYQTTDKQLLGQSLTRPFLRIEHSRSGLAKVSINKPKIVKETKAAQKLGTYNIQSAGHDVGKSVYLQTQFTE